MYQMTTISSGTRIRDGHSTFAGIVTSVNAGVTVIGDEIWMAPADGNEVKQGDQWLHVTSPAVGWMAYKHKGQMICMDLHEVTVEPPPEPPVNPYSVEFVISPLGMIDQIRIKGPVGAHANIFYNDFDVVIAGI